MRIAVPLQLSSQPFMVRDAAATVTALDGETMGTSWSVRVVGATDGLAAAIRQRLDLMVAQMSHWEPTSQLCRYNRAAAGSWHGVGAEFFTVLQSALAVAEQSRGAFDPTAGALVDRWGFGASGPATAFPDEAEIAVLRAANAGADRVMLDPHALRVLQPGGVMLDLSAIAKGYAVDDIADLLRRRGHGDFLVEIGGELRGEGIKPDGQPWWVDLEVPPGATLEGLRVALHGLSVATSGDYRRFADHGGRRLPHSIDPRTGRPIDNALASVSVLHPDCMMADAYATALTVLGPEEGRALAADLELAALFVVRTVGGFAEWRTPALDAML